MRVFLVFLKISCELLAVSHTPFCYSFDFLLNGVFLAARDARIDERQEQADQDDEGRERHEEDYEEALLPLLIV